MENKPIEEMKSNPNTGHGHVFRRLDGVKMRCGGPAICSECSKDLARSLKIGKAQAQIVPTPEFLSEPIEGGAEQRSWLFEAIRLLSLYHNGYRPKDVTREFLGKVEAIWPGHQEGAASLNPSPAGGETGVALIQAERLRQVAVEGWTPEHDDQHRSGEMLGAATSYLQEGWARLFDEAPLPESSYGHGEWPWDAKWWKPSPDPIRNLVKASALIAAEIDRLQRAASLNPKLGTVEARGTCPTTEWCSVCGAHLWSDKGNRHDNCWQKSGGRPHSWVPYPNSELGTVEQGGAQLSDALDWVLGKAD